MKTLLTPDRRAARSVLFALLLAPLASLPAAEPDDTNYDESKVPDYTLPDPLVYFDGRRVADTNGWRELRRPELLEAFATNVYGRTPRLLTRQRVETTETNAQAFGDLATRKQLTIRLFDETDAPWIDLLIYIPNHTSKPVPVFLGLSYGNQGVHTDPSIKPSRRTTSKRGEHASRWPLETILKRGYAVATFAGADVEQDRHGSGSLQEPDGWKTGVRGYLLKRSGRTELADDEWGSIGAWAWGLSRALDYLETDSAIDSHKVVVFGHSRTGKAALWAAAQDERFAIAISNESGQGGAALAKRRYGETVAASYSISGIWYCRNYRRFGNNEASLPVDQHMLIALIAPRPLYIASAEQDRWSDPRGEFLSGLHAESVYQLFGLTGLGVKDLPPVDHPIGQMIGYHIRTGDHDITSYDWEQYLNFADRHLGREKSKKASKDMLRGDLISHPN